MWAGLEVAWTLLHHIWMRFTRLRFKAYMDEVQGIYVCKVILEFRLESKLNKNDFW